MSIATYSPGADVAVDECMICYLGRSYEITLVPRKPDPIGFKVWVIA